MDRVKLIVLWSKSADSEAFHADYAATHLALALKVPGVLAMDAWQLRSRDYGRVAELYFESEAAFRTAMESHEWGHLVTDVQRLEATHQVASSSHLAYMNAAQLESD